jgi:hypothetical protein
MTKTLRITTITAALLAAGFLVFSAVFGARGDKAVEEFLKSPGAIEKFQRTQVDEGTDQISPLVKQAQAFALYLNPPPPKQPAISRPSRVQQQPPRPTVTSPKFKLLGTSFYASHPDLSLALIDEVGKGIHWVRRLGRVGHLVIEQIKDGLVVIKDGSRTFEVTMVERSKKVNLVKSSTLDETDAEAALLQAAGQAMAVPPAPDEDEAAGQIGSEESAESMAEDDTALDELVRELKAIQAAGQAETEDDEADVALDKFIETLRISAKEAERLNNLGRELQNGGAEPNIVDDHNNTKIERKPRPPRREK